MDKTVEAKKYTIYTIGHSTQSQESFINLLKKYNITCVVDVRSTPYSQYAVQFNENEIKAALESAGIVYIYMGKEFGARREDAELYDSDNKLNFKKTAQCYEFLSGIERIRKGAQKGYNIAFMCTEKDPIDCHRCILLGREFNALDDFTVENILISGDLVSQDDIAIKLLEMYFPDRNQINILEYMYNKIKTEDEYISEAYEKRAKEIAYQIQG